MGRAAGDEVLVILTGKQSIAQQATSVVFKLDFPFAKA
jgi:hypothetical protein